MGQRITIVIVHSSLESAVRLVTVTALISSSQARHRNRVRETVMRRQRVTNPWFQQLPPSTIDSGQTTRLHSRRVDSPGL